MRGHVVQTFGFVDIALVVFGRDFLEKIFQIRLDVGIGVLLNEQRGRGVAAENRQESGRDILRAKPARDLGADLDKTFAAGLNVQAMERLAHRTFCWFEQGHFRYYDFLLFGHHCSRCVLWASLPNLS